jgi:hypothetical protein
VEDAALGVEQHHGLGHAVQRSQAASQLEISLAQAEHHTQGAGEVRQQQAQAEGVFVGEGVGQSPIAAA